MSIFNLKSFPGNQSGFTLVELLVGMTVGVLVLGTVGALYVPSLATYRSNQAVSSIQENERSSVNVLSRLVDQAGFFGCDSSDTEKFVNVTNLSYTGPTWAAQVDIPVTITAANLDAATFIGGAAGSDQDASGNDRPADSGQTIGDVVTVFTGGGSSGVLIGHDPVAETLTFRGDVLSDLDDKYILLNDCTQTTLLQIGAGVVNDNGTAGDASDDSTVFSYASADTNNCAHPDEARVLLGGSVDADCSNNTQRRLYANYEFAAGVNSSNLVSTSFYLAQSGVKSNLISLYAISTSGGSFGTASELIAGVENMRARYGVLDSDGTINYLSTSEFDLATFSYTGTSPPPGPPVDVVSLELSLMLSSLTSNGERDSVEKQKITFLDTGGNEVECDTASSSSSNDSACPSYLFATNESARRLRRVITKVYNLRNVTL